MKILRKGQEKTLKNMLQTAAEAAGVLKIVLPELSTEEAMHALLRFEDANKAAFATLESYGGLTSEQIQDVLSHFKMERGAAGFGFGGWEDVSKIVAGYRYAHTYVSLLNMLRRYCGEMTVGGEQFMTLMDRAVGIGPKAES